MGKQEHRANSGSRGSVFNTPGGRSYLENLQRIRPTEATKQAVAKAVKRAEEAAAKED